MRRFIDEGWVKQSLPKRAATSHKGSFGSLAVLGGCTRYRGAPVLAAAGALRAGAGLVHLAATERVCAAAAAQLPSLIFCPLDESSNGGIQPTGLLSKLPQTTALLAGCGMGNSADTADILQALLTHLDRPLVLDADALNVLAGHLDTGHDDARRQALLPLLAQYPAPVILTPHLAEMARLCAKPTAEVAETQEQTALDFAQQHGCTVVLKSHVTVVATPQGDCYINTAAGNAGLAKGGSGDVLAGVVASLLAQGLAPPVAAGAGVWLHATAGDIAAARYSQAGLSPADLPLCLCEVLRGINR